MATSRIAASTQVKVCSAERESASPSDATWYQGRMKEKISAAAAPPVRRDSGGSERSVAARLAMGPSLCPALVDRDVLDLDGPLGLALEAGDPPVDQRPQRDPQVARGLRELARALGRHRRADHLEQPRQRRE